MTQEQIDKMEQELRYAKIKLEMERAAQAKECNHMINCWLNNPNPEMLKLTVKLQSWNGSYSEVYVPEELTLDIMTAIKFAIESEL